MPFLKVVYFSSENIEYVSYRDLGTRLDGLFLNMTHFQRDITVENIQVNEW